MAASKAIDYVIAGCAIAAVAVAIAWRVVSEQQVSAPLATEVPQETKVSQETLEQERNQQKQQPGKSQTGVGGNQSKERRQEAASGRYGMYSPAAVQDVRYTATILFFYAGWCPECRAFERAIRAGSIPDATQILVVDFDNSDDLRRRYGVTLQSTFVRVDTTGAKQALWVGYGKEKSTATILENTR